MHIYIAATRGVSHNSRRMIRTSFVLQNVLAHLVKDDFHYRAIKAVHKGEEKFFRKLSYIIDQFKNENRECRECISNALKNLNENTLHSILRSTFEGIFQGGVTWARIIGLFLFVGQMAVSCRLRKIPVSTLYEHFHRLVKDELEIWIQEHGNWEGILSLYDKKNYVFSCFKAEDNFFIFLIGLVGVITVFNFFELVRMA